MDTTFYYQLDLDTQWLCTVLCAMWLTGSTRPRGTKKPRRRSSALARVHWSPLETSRTLFHTHNNNPLPHYPFVPLPYFSVSRRFFRDVPPFCRRPPGSFPDTFSGNDLILWKSSCSIFLSLLFITPAWSAITASFRAPGCPYSLIMVILFKSLFEPYGKEI